MSGEEGGTASGLVRVWPRMDGEPLSRMLRKPVVLSECPWLAKVTVLTGTWPAGLATGTAKVATRSVTLFLYP